MRCKLNDLVMVVRSEVGNEGRIGRIVGRAVAGQLLSNGTVVYPGEDWIVEGRFNMAYDHILSCCGHEVARWEEGRHEVDALSFPDAWLRPIRGDGLGDETPTDAEQPQPADLRAWGKATVMAISAGYIEKMPRVFMPAASSNGSPKATYRKGVKA